MTDNEMYDLLCRKAQNIKMHMDPGDVAMIALRFRELMEQDRMLKEACSIFDRLCGRGE